MFVSNANLTLGFESDFRIILHYTLARFFHFCLGKE